MPNQTPPNQSQTTINSDGGAVAHEIEIHEDYVRGNKVGGDKVDGNKVGGDKVDGSKITINVNITPQQWEPLFQQVLGPDLLPDPHHNNLQEALRQLSGYGDKTLPLKFLTLLGERLRPEEAQKLTTFIEEKTSFTPTELNAIQIEAKTVEPTYLLVEVAPMPATPEHYTVRIYHGPMDHARQPVCIGDEDKFLLRDVAQHIHQVESSLPQKAQAIEVFLPVELLAEQSAIEQWEYEKELAPGFSIKSRLFAQHAVTVRVQQRQYGQWRKNLSEWQDKWQTVTTKTLGEIVQLLSNQTINKQHLIEYWPTDKEKAFTVLQEKPNEFELIVFLLMNAHVPAILWHRACFQKQPSSIAGWVAQLSQVWQECDAHPEKTLFDVVHSWRTCGSKNIEKAEFGQQLTLIWEDPYRMIPNPKEPIP